MLGGTRTSSMSVDAVPRSCVFVGWQIAWKGTRGSYLPSATTFGNVRYRDEPIKLGSLNGNQFSVVIRQVQTNGNIDMSTNDIIELAVSHLKSDGFINYFGLQRFGTSSVPTHHVGRELLQENWSAAVDLILNPRKGDPSLVASARTHFQETRNVEKALHEFPSFLIAECAVLNGLQEFGNKDFRGALNRIPRKLRMVRLQKVTKKIFCLFFIKFLDRFMHMLIKVLSGTQSFRND